MNETVTQLSLCSLFFNTPTETNESNVSMRNVTIIKNIVLQRRNREVAMNQVVLLGLAKTKCMHVRVDLRSRMNHLFDDRIMT